MMTSLNVSLLQISVQCRINNFLKEKSMDNTNTESQVIEEKRLWIGNLDPRITE